MGLCRFRCFVVDGAEHVAVAVSSAWVAPGFGPFEDGLGELVACVPGSGVEQLDLQAPEERFDDCVVKAITDRTH